MGDLSNLVESIRERGVLEPILVRKLTPEEQPKSSSGARDPNTPAARFLIIAGERRYRAALEAGLFEIPVVELSVDRSQALELALVENLQRKDLNPFEEAEGYRTLIERHGYTQERIAKIVGKSRSTVAETLALLALPPELRTEAQRLGIHARSALLAVARAKPEERKKLLEKAAQQGWTRDDLRATTRKSQDDLSKRRERPKPFVFRFRSPDRRYRLEIAFRQKTVVKSDLIQALERILEELRNAPEEPLT
jgi:ParB family chromosome partitioning protein